MRSLALKTSRLLTGFREEGIDDLIFTRTEAPPSDQPALPGAPASRPR